LGRGGWEIPAGQKINHNPLSYRWSSVYMALIACLVWIPAGQEMEASNLSFFTNHLLSLPPAPDCSCSNSGLLFLLVASFTCKRHYTPTYTHTHTQTQCFQWIATIMMPRHNTLHMRIDALCFQYTGNKRAVNARAASRLPITHN